MDRYEALKELCTENQIKILYVFGSRSKEVLYWLRSEIEQLEPTPADVDIGVKFAPSADIDVRKKAETAVQLEDLLDVTRVDLAAFSDVDPFVAANIIRGERLYCEDTTAADEFELYILRRAGDLAPFERQRLAQIEAHYEPEKTE